MIDRSPRVDTKLEIAVLKKGNTEMFQFYCLNLSITGMLIASLDKFNINVDDSMSLVIDPWKEHLASFVSCDVRVARIVESTSKGLEKYKSHFGESKDISTIVGVYYEDLHAEHAHTISTYMKLLSAKNAA